MPVLIDKQVSANKWKKRAGAALARRAVQETLRSEAIPIASEVSVTLAEDALLQQLNRDYRGVDAPTDVLSFQQEESPGERSDLDQPAGVPGPPRALGDIVVSLEAVERQALEHQVTFERELVLLVIHASLHLLGYDHAEAPEKARMWRRQNEILERVMGRSGSSNATKVCPS
ncbi:MAG TPA: rRNA maturation RNase YbeY [Armatimonadota bacterium]|nr:rRNA maturation RNase YbeY [Armatimonadota bacterium]